MICSKTIAQPFHNLCKVGSACIKDDISRLVPPLHMHVYMVGMPKKQVVKCTARFTNGNVLVQSTSLQQA